VSTDSADKILTYWLIPAEPALGYFRSSIRDLARQYDAPVFEPHMTIYTTESHDKNAPKLLERLLNRRGLYRLRVSGIDYSEEFTKTLFVQFEPNQSLTELSQDLRHASALKPEYELNPHLSLIYKTLPRQTKAEIARSLHLPFTEVEFNSAKAVISPANIQCRKDVEDWEVVATQELTG
jgi:2'-5' RNA ligase